MRKLIFALSFGLWACTPVAQTPAPSSPAPPNALSDCGAAGEPIPSPLPGSLFNIPEDLEQGKPYLEVQDPNTCQNPTVTVRALQFTPGTCTALRMQERESGTIIELGAKRVAGDTQVSFAFDASTYPQGIYTFTLESQSTSEQAIRQIVMGPCVKNTPVPFPINPGAAPTPGPEPTPTPFPRVPGYTPSPTPQPVKEPPLVAPTGPRNGPGTPLPSSISERLYNQPVQMSPRDVAVFSDGFRMGYEYNNNDTRCGTDETCEDPGQVQVRLRLEVKGITEEVDLFLGGDEDQSQLTWNGYRITLFAVEPRRIISHVQGATAQKSYAIFEVERV